MMSSTAKNIFKTGIIVGIAYLVYRKFYTKSGKKIVYDRGFEFEIQEDNI